MTYHFIGLGGIGMSALARILLQKGGAVFGSDVKRTNLLDELEKEGAKIQIGHSVERIPSTATVVYSTDIKKENIELQWASQHNMRVLHRSDLLHELMNDKKKILVTGTHGKTTTTALLVSVLIEANLDPSFVVGGLIRSLNTNGRAGSGDYFVAEADESDGSFLKSAADYAIITNLEDDHLDYWGSSRMLDLGFKQFIAASKHLVWCKDDLRLQSFVPKGSSYGFTLDADFPITNYQKTKSGIRFDLKETKGIELRLFGKHNALNGAAVFILCKMLNISDDVICSAFQKFSGTKRRLEFVASKHKVSVFDDYGHHPTEIKATIKAFREHLKERRLVVVFQPHRYSRVRDLFNDFSSAFDEADEVFMTDIYSAGEIPIEGITSAALYTKMREKLGAKLKFFPRTHLEVGVSKSLKPLDVVLTTGAGDITKAGLPILESFAERAPMIKIAILFGGRSSERDVSLASAKNIVKALDVSVYKIEIFGISKEGHWYRGFEMPKVLSEGISDEILKDLKSCDICIPVFHGPYGEDGMIAGLLETLSIPYVGCDYRSSAICMQKGWTKHVAKAHSVAVGPFFEIDAWSIKKDPEIVLKKIDANFGFPVWVKPVHLGSSIGIRKVVSKEELFDAVSFALEYDDVLIIEKDIVGRQIEFSILGNDHIQVALPSEIINHGAFVGYDKKYGESAMPIKTPADLSEEKKEEGISLAKTVYRACNCKGLARVDFFLDEMGHYWFNEINPFPGFTDTSAFPDAFIASGFTMSEVVDEMVALALARNGFKIKSLNPKREAPPWVLEEVKL